MNTYSQSSEDLFVLNYFGDYKGTLLEIGANGGELFSNSKLLIENGWRAELIEPGDIFEDLIYLYPAEKYPQIELAKLAIGDRNETVCLFNSGSHVPNGEDKGLVSTIDPLELKRWPNVVFHPKDVQMVTWAEYLKSHSVNKRFDFISIDAEGFDAIILQQMDLFALGCRCLCIEYNSNPDLLKLFSDYCAGYKLELINAENLVFCK